MKKPKRTILDTELHSFACMGASSGLLAAFSADLAQGPSKVEVKLIVDPNRKDDLHQWVDDVDGDMSSFQGEVALVEIPPGAFSNLEDPSKHPWLRRVEAPRKMFTHLDEARADASRLDDAVATTGLTGSGVVVGLVDTGLDWTHDDFRHDDDTTRLEMFAHAQGSFFAGVWSSTYDFFDKDGLNDALSGSTHNVPTGDAVGHGTHCASIAAGNGRASQGKYRGVATEATIMAMRSEPLLDTHTIRGIREIFQRAGDRPAVINLSLGGHRGAHDGTSAIENVISKECGPGRIIVVAAGNEGNDGIHRSGRLIEGETLTLPFRVSDPSYQFVDIWIPRGDDVDIVIEAPDGVQYDPDGQQHSTVFGQLVAEYIEEPTNHDFNLRVFVINGKVNHTWAIKLKPDSVLHGEVHAWSGTKNSSNASQLFPGNHGSEYSIGMPGTEDRAIVVGSFVSRNNFPVKGGATLTASGLTVGALSPFSSQGPTRLGIQKPDVVAPGQYITAALADGCHYATSPLYTPRHSPTSGYITIQGTSMAAPFMAGVIALMLEREPTLTPEEIQQRLRVTSCRDEWTGRVWNPAYGYGKLDVEALLSYQP